MWRMKQDRGRKGRRRAREETAGARSQGWTRGTGHRVAKFASEMAEMTAVTKGPCLVYFIAFWLCRELVGAAKDRLPPQTGDSGNVCCSEEAPIQCLSDATSRKECGSGERYTNRQCDKCRAFQCKAGEEMHCTGTIDYNYYCKKCLDGTYLDGKTGCCVAWTNCRSLGLQTVQSGNSTHNVQCGIILSSVEKESMFTNVLSIVTVAGIFLVILMMISLLLCMWVQKREKLTDVEDLGIVDTPNLVQHPQQQEDTFSCQYPEEERGDKTTEERDAMPFLAH